MTWAAIIAAILQIFGPMLADWLKKWLDSWLNKAAAEMPEPRGYATESGAAAALFDKAIEMLPRLAFGRRALLRRMRHIVSDHGITELSEVSSVELSDLAKLAEND